MALSVHIVTDQNEFLQRSSLISKLAYHWQKAGHRMTYGLVNSIDTDLGILHLDQTKITLDDVPKNPEQRPFLNDKVLDISKSNFSTLRLQPNDGWDGPVIIKSNLNCFGSPEWKKSENNFFAKTRRSLAKNFWRLARRLPPGRYPILNDLRTVPQWVWENPEIIVERFMPERDGKYYCLRGWVFFGQRGYTYKLYSIDGIVKTKSVVKYEFLDQPPAELVDFRMKNSFDFGKFDYVVVDGKAILLDINKTPHMVSDANTPRLKSLAEGINEFMENCL